MNTNYSKWEKFDVDEELEEIERKGKVEEFQRQQVKSTNATLAAEKERQEKAQSDSWKKRDDEELEYLNNAVKALLKAKKFPGFHHMYKETCKVCHSEGLCLHREGMPKNPSPEQVAFFGEVGETKGADATSNSDEYMGKNSGGPNIKADDPVIEGTSLRSTIFDTTGFDVSSWSDRMIAVSNTITEVIRLVQTLNQYAEDCNYFKGYAVGCEAILMISEVNKFLLDSKELMHVDDARNEFPPQSDDFASCLECGTTAVPNLPVKLLPGTSSSSSSSSSCCSNCDTVFPPQVVIGSQRVDYDSSTSSFDSTVLSLSKLRVVTVTLVAQLAFNKGDLAAAIELSRCAIKLRESEAQTNRTANNRQLIETDDVMMWVIRGGAFAMIGNPYLARVHFRQASALLEDFPGLDVLLVYVDELESRSYANFLPLSNDSLDGTSTKLSWRDRLKTDIDVLTSLFIREVKYFRKLESVDPQRIKIERLGSCPVDIKYLKGFIEDHLEENSNGTTMEELYMSFSDSNEFLEWIRKIYYEAQILFSEQMYHSAEAKFIIAIAMINVYVSRQEERSLPTDEMIKTQIHSDKYLNAMKICCIVNSITCRLKRFHASSVCISSSACVAGGVFNGTISLLIDSSALDLCNYALQLSDGSLHWYDEVLVLLVKVEVLESMKLYEDTFDVLSMLQALSSKKAELNESAVEERKVSPVFVDSYNDKNLFTQNFVCGTNLFIEGKTMVGVKDRHFRDKLKLRLDQKRRRIEYLSRTRR